MLYQIKSKFELTNIEKLFSDFYDDAGNKLDGWSKNGYLSINNNKSDLSSRLLRDGCITIADKISYSPKVSGVYDTNFANMATVGYSRYDYSFIHMPISLDGPANSEERQFSAVINTPFADSYATPKLKMLSFVVTAMMPTNVVISLTLHTETSGIQIYFTTPAFAIPVFLRLIMKDENLIKLVTMSSLIHNPDNLVSIELITWASGTEPTRP